MIRVAFILFIFIMSISSCQKERPNILAPENVITSPETNYVYITNFVTNNGIITITIVKYLLYLLKFQTHLMMLRKCLPILYISLYKNCQKEVNILN